MASSQARSADFHGKRLRPALVLLAGRACGLVTPAHSVLAAVVEMIHTATLVHDDILDEAMVRRHAATVNAECLWRTCFRAMFRCLASWTGRRFGWPLFGPSSEKQRQHSFP